MDGGQCKVSAQEAGQHDAVGPQWIGLEVASRAKIAKEYVQGQPYDHHDQVHWRNKEETFWINQRSTSIAKVNLHNPMSGCDE